MTDDPTPRQIFFCPMRANDAYAKTVGEYLVVLLRDVWQQEQGFNGKRPFGNSAWQWEVYESLGDAGLIEVTYSEFDEPQLADRAAVDALIEKTILLIPESIQ